MYDDPKAEVLGHRISLILLNIEIYFTAPTFGIIEI